MSRSKSKKRSADTAFASKNDAKNGVEVDCRDETLARNQSSSEEGNKPKRPVEQESSAVNNGQNSEAGERHSVVQDKGQVEVDEQGNKAGEKQTQAQGNVRKVIVILDEATMEAVRTSQGAYELLNCDDHLGLHKKLNKDPSKSRPDISHQMLLALLDSPLNKAGHLELFIRTHENVLVKVSPHIRIPRTFKRFSGLMVQLLHKLKVRSADGNETLLKVVKNPVSRHLPPNSRIFAMSVTGTLIDAHDFVTTLPDTDPYVFVFGAFAHGHVNVDYAEALISLSEYPLSGACAVARLLNAFERKWRII